MPLPIWGCVRRNITLHPRSAMSLSACLKVCRISGSAASIHAKCTPKRLPCKGLLVACPGKSSYRLRGIVVGATNVEDTPDRKWSHFKLCSHSSSMREPYIQLCSLRGEIETEQHSMIEKAAITWSRYKGSQRPWSQDVTQFQGVAVHQAKCWPWTLAFLKEHSRLAPSDSHGNDFFSLACRRLIQRFSMVVLWYHQRLRWQHWPALHPQHRLSKDHDSWWRRLSLDSLSEMSCPLLAWTLQCHTGLLEPYLTLHHQPLHCRETEYCRSVSAPKPMSGHLKDKTFLWHHVFRCHALAACNVSHCNLQHGAFIMIEVWNQSLGAMDYNYQ